MSLVKNLEEMPGLLAGKSGQRLAMVIGIDSDRSFFFFQLCVQRSLAPRFPFLGNNKLHERNMRNVFNRRVKFLNNYFITIGFRSNIIIYLLTSLLSIRY
jgi:hypothetical protein